MKVLFYAIAGFASLVGLSSIVNGTTPHIHLVYAISPGDCVLAEGTIGCPSPPPESNCPATNCQGFQHGPSIIWRCVTAEPLWVTSRVRHSAHMGTISEVRYRQVNETEVGHPVTPTGILPVECYNEQYCKCVPIGAGSVQCQTDAEVHVIAVPKVTIDTQASCTTGGGGGEEGCE